MGLGTYLCTEKAYFAGFLVKMAFSDKEAEDWGAGPFPGTLIVNTAAGLKPHNVKTWSPASLSAVERVLSSLITGPPQPLLPRTTVLADFP